MKATWLEILGSLIMGMGTGITIGGIIMAADGPLVAGAILIGTGYLGRAIFAQQRINN